MRYKRDIIIYYNDPDMALDPWLSVLWILQFMISEYDYLKLGESFLDILL